MTTGVRDGPAGARPPEIAALYEAFAGCTIPETLAYCTYCDHAEYERALHAPLETLPHELMDKYLADAIHHTGSEADFAYFIPRILEIEYEAPIGRFHDLAERLEMAGWTAWPAERRAALCRAIACIARRGDRSDEWLDAAARIEGVPWGEVFSRLPGLDDPRSGQAEWLWLAIRRREVMDGAQPIDRALCAWLDSPEGARFSEEFLARTELP
jgi:hypothetical protein